MLKKFLPIIFLFAGFQANAAPILSVDFGTAVSPLETEGSFVGQSTLSQTHSTGLGDLMVSIGGDQLAFHNRGGIVDNGAMTYADLFTDWLYNNGPSVFAGTTNTLFTFSGDAIAANTAYDITFWAWDSHADGILNRNVSLTGQSGTTGSSTLNWTAGLAPISNTDYSNTSTYTSDALGFIRIEAIDNHHLRIPGLTISSASVPEPTTLVLLGLGLVGISFSRRKAA